MKYGLTIWDLLEEKLAEDGEEKITVDEALQRQKFQRIYIMLGINELGRGTPETFSDQYEKVIERIKQLLQFSGMKIHSGGITANCVAHNTFFMLHTKEFHFMAHFPKLLPYFENIGFRTAVGV